MPSWRDRCEAVFLLSAAQCANVRFSNRPFEVKRFQAIHWSVSTPATLVCERIRDKIAASKKKGMWMGGLPSLGYDIKDRRLIINEAEANTVRHIVRRYTELKYIFLK